MLRVGMVSPYSLSVPGGVQMQVMGLARELRRMGYEVRVLGPCDGPPPATFVTPLGNSLPTSTNGSIAPLAPDPACVLRTMRVLFEEQFDVLHLHEPFAPGPPMTSMLLHPAPVIATFHAAGDSPSYRYGSAPMKAAAKNIARRIAVSKDALALVQEAQRLAPHDAVQAGDVFGERKAAAGLRDSRGAHGAGLPGSATAPVSCMKAELMSWAPASVMISPTGPRARTRP